MHGTLSRLLVTLRPHVTCRTVKRPTTIRDGVLNRGTPGHIARDVEAARQKQNLEKHLPKPRGSEHGAAKRGAHVETQKESPELITVSAGLKSMFGKLWNTIEDLAYGEPPEGVTREDWVKEQMARHEQHREQEAAKRRSVVKEKPKPPRRDEEEDEWHDRLDSSGFWNQR